MKHTDRTSEGQKLLKYMKAGKKLYITANDKATQWNIYYIAYGAMQRVSLHHFLTKDIQETYRKEYNRENGQDYIKKMDKKGAIAMPAYYAYNDKEYNFRCTAGGTSRAVELIVAIGYALGLKFLEIKQNYQIL